MALLECSINGTDIDVALAAGSHFARLHDDVASVVEHATCNYGLNVDFDRIVSSAGLRVVGVDGLGEVRAVERTDHPFFVATLYQPQLCSSPARPHPVFTGLVRAATGRADSR